MPVLVLYGNSIHPTRRQRSSRLSEPEVMLHQNLLHRLKIEVAIPKGISEFVTFNPTLFEISLFLCFVAYLSVQLIVFVPC
jgi:hypothetical protein